MCPNFAYICILGDDWPSGSCSIPNILASPSDAIFNWNVSVNIVLAFEVNKEIIDIDVKNPTFYSSQISIA